MSFIKGLFLGHLILFWVLLHTISYTHQVDIRYSCIDFPYDDAYINSKAPTITGSLYDAEKRPVAAETVQIFLNNELVGSAISNPYGIYRYTLPQELEDGSYRVFVFCLDSGIELCPVTMYIDTKIPLTAIILPEENESISTSMVTITGTTEQDALVTVYINEDTYGQICYADQGGAWSLDCELPDGRYTVTAQATDRAGNQGPLSKIRNFVVTIVN